MKKSTIFLSFLFCLLCTATSHAQDLDSLISQCKKQLMSPSFFELRDSAERIILETGDVDKIMGIKRLLVFRHYIEGNTDSLHEIADEVRELAAEAGNWYVYFDTWAYLINHYVFTGMTERAISEASEMGKEALERDQPLGIALSYTTSGDAYLSLGLYQEAISNVSRGIDEMEKMKDTPVNNIFNACYTIILAYQGLRQYGDMIRYCEKMDSLAVKAEKASMDKMAPVAYRLISNSGKTIAYSHLQRLASAKECYEKALSLYWICDDHLDYLLEAEAIFFEESGEYKRAVNSYDELSIIKR